MKAQIIKELLKKQPFSPFKLALVDGREFAVRHPELIALVPDNRTAIHFSPIDSQDYEFTFIELPLVATVQPLGNGTRGRKKKRKAK